MSFSGQLLFISILIAASLIACWLCSIAGSQWDYLSTRSPLSRLAAWLVALGAALIFGMVIICLAGYFSYKFEVARIILGTINLTMLLVIGLCAAGLTWLLVARARRRFRRAYAATLKKY